MIKFRIAGMEIEQPDGLNGFYIERNRDDVFGGFIRQRIASVKGIGEVTIMESEVCMLLKYAWDNYGYDAVLPFEITEDDEVIYQAEVDFGQYSTNDKGKATISFRDVEAISIFDANVDKVVELSPIHSVIIPKTDLSGSTSHSIVANSILYKLGETKVVLFAPTLKVSNKDSVGGGLGIDVNNPLVISPFWQNTGLKSVQVLVQGIIEFTAKSNTNDLGNLSIIVKKAGVLIESVNIYQFTTGTVINSNKVVINSRLTIPVGGDVTLQVEGTTGLTSFEYNLISGDISITEDFDIIDTETRGIFVHDAFAQLVDIASEGMLGFSDEAYLTSGLFLTNGLCLKDNEANIQVSLTSLFSGLNKLHNLVLGIEDNTVKLKYKSDAFQNAIATDIDNITDISSAKITTLSKMFISEIKLGYANWKSDTVLGNLEFNSTRTYSTGTRKAKDTADKTISEFVAASKLIEKQRRLQFEVLASSQKTDTKLDNTLFLIDTDGIKAKVGVLGLNESLNPITQLKNQLFDCGNNKAFYYQTGDGNVEATVLGEKQNQDFIATNGFFTGRTVLIEGSTELIDYLSIGDIVNVTVNNEIISALVKSDNYRLQTNTFTIEGYEIA